MVRVVIVIASAALLCTPAQACLDKDRAARTWPLRQLMVDDDGCWTYRKVPVPIERPAEPPVRIMRVVQVKPLDPPLVDRWPAPEETMPLIIDKPDEGPPLWRRLASVAFIVVFVATIMNFIPRRSV